MTPQRGRAARPGRPVPLHRDQRLQRQRGAARLADTVSGNGDQGADPNKLVVITDRLGATALPAESFATEGSAGSGEVLRGVSFTPGTTTW